MEEQKLEESKISEYFLSQQLFSHQAAVRCLDINNDLLISGSIDKKSSIFKKNNQQKFEIFHNCDFCTDYIFAVQIRKGSNGGYIIGCKDSKIYILDSEFNPIGELEGHKNAVNSLSQIDDDFLISGSWDGTAKVWSISSSLCVETLEGHSFAVTVLALSNQIILTGSQDKNINIWDSMNNFKKINTIQNAHNDIIREFAEVQGMGFLSCSNDETIKLWTYEGDPLSVLQGHSSFVFSVKCLDFGHYVSGSEDKSIKIWQNDHCVQTILHPATVWYVAINQENHDILTACADGVVRIFTKDPQRKAEQTQIQEFSNSSSMAQMQGPESQLTGSDIEKLPSINQMGSIFGNKDGEIKLFKNNNTAEAYVWKAAEYKWEKIGEVLNTVPRKYYEGDQFFPQGEYDYVFDVDDETGVPKRIPFNNGDNPLEAAEKYIVRENLNKKLYLEQITNFLRQNTKPKQQQQQQQKQQKSNQISSQQNQNLIQQQQQQQFQQQQNQKQLQEKIDLEQGFQFFPISEYMYYETANFEALKKKVLEFNETIKQNEKLSNLVVNHKDTYYLEKIVNVLQDMKNSQMDFTEMQLFTQKLLNWPKEYILPVYDMLRMFLLHFQSEVLFKGLDSGRPIIQNLSAVIQNSENEPLISLCLRVFCNMFKHEINKNGLMYNFGLLIDCLKSIEQKFSSKSSQNLRREVSTVFFNVSIALGEKSINKSIIVDYLETIKLFIVKEDANTLLLKYFVCIGNVLMKCADCQNEVKLIVGSVIQQKQLVGEGDDFNKAQNCKKDLFYFFK